MSAHALTAIEDGGAGGGASALRIRFGHLLAAVIAPVVLVAGQGKRDELAALQFRDPDDALRLLEVRDWMAGQSWFDVAQHRMDWTGGGSMHWSRLVDLPIAVVQLVARLFVDAAQAERVALVVVPLATLAVTLILLGLVARRLLGDAPALLAVALVIPSITVLRQFEMMRIDHHGWQMAAALAIALGLLAQRPTRGAGTAGLAGAFWLAISIEGLPFVAAALGLLGLRFAMNGEARPLRAFAVSFALGCLGLSMLAHGGAFLGDAKCDALSMAYLPAFAVFAIGVTVATQTVRGPASMRFAALAVVALAATAVLVGGGSACADGPFGTFDPLVSKFWYLRVYEGLPLWRQEAVPVAATMLVPVIGLAGSLWAWRAAGPDAARRWFTAIVLLAAALVITVFLNRFEGVAKLLALPGIAAAVTLMWRWAKQRPGASRQGLAVAGIVLAVLPMPLLAIVLTAVEPATKTVSIRCTLPREIAALNQLPPGARLLAPLDLGPAILVATPHRVMATGHHRSKASMHDVIAAFSGAERDAHRIVAKHGVEYVVVCGDMLELDYYRNWAKGSFATDLTNGRIPDWLEHVRLRGTTMQVWRVR